MNKPISFEEAKQKLIEQIETNAITNENELMDYVNVLGVNERKDELISLGKQKLQEKNLQLTPIKELQEEFIKQFNDAIKDGKQISFDFKAVDSTLNEDYMEISVITKKNDVRYEYPKKVVIFNEDAKKNLIEPVLKEIILKSKIEYNVIKDVPSFVNERANYYLKTIENCFFNISNIEKYYARELEELINELKQRFGDNNSEEIKEELDEEMKLVRKKPEQNGYINLIFIFVISEFVSGLMFLLQMFLLN